VPETKVQERIEVSKGKIGAQNTGTKRKRVTKNNRDEQSTV